MSVKDEDWLVRAAPRPVPTPAPVPVERLVSEVAHAVDRDLTLRREERTKLLHGQLGVDYHVVAGRRFLMPPDRTPAAKDLEWLERIPPCAGCGRQLYFNAAGRLMEAHSYGCRMYDRPRESRPLKPSRRDRYGD